MLTDEQLVNDAVKARPGDLRAFDELVRRHQARVRTNCRYLSGNDEDAQDLAQEVLVKTYFNLARFEGRSSFGTWLGRIKVNHCLNHMRRRRDEVLVDVADPALESEPALRSRQGAAKLSEDRSLRERISTVLDGLPEGMRVPLIMRDLDGLAYQEIADELSLGLSAAKMRVKRARVAFRTAFTEEPGNE